MIKLRGLEASVVLSDGETLLVRGIFNPQFSREFLGENTLESTKAQFFLDAEPVNKVKDGDEVTIEGSTYKMLNKDVNYGLATLYLR